MQGRSHGEKSLVVLGIEKVINKKGVQTIGRAYARIIDTASAKDLKPFFEDKIDISAKVTTDGWRGYLPLHKDWQIKGWLRGIHHQCDKQRLQNYLDEFHFRFNRRNFLDSILDKLLQRAVANIPTPYKDIKCVLNT